MNTKNLRKLRWALLAVWVAIFAITGPFSGKLAEVQENDALSFLPRSAESTQVVELEEQFRTDSDVISTVVVYERSDGLTPQDFALAEEHRAELANRFGLAPEAQPLVPSDNGNALLLTTELPDNEDTLFDDVETVREVVADQPAGLEIKVTGAAASIYDNVSVFEDLDIRVLVTTASIVTILLLLIYRSPFLWLVPLVVVAAANGLAAFAVYQLVENVGITLDGQSQGLLSILVFGAGTDYALLLIARYREELRRHESPVTAMGIAVRRAGPAIIASGATVIAGLLCLLAADLNSTRGLGPIGAVGIASAMVAMLTLLPAILMVVGRKVFWPFVPRFGDPSNESSGRWAQLGKAISHHPRRVWVTTLALLLIAGLGTTSLGTGLSFAQQFRTAPDSVLGQEILGRNFTAGSAQPATVISRQDVSGVLSSAPMVANVQETGRVDGLIRYAVSIDAEPGSDTEATAIEELRTSLTTVPEAQALVGGNGAQSVDSDETSSRDKQIVIPLVLLVVLVILIALLRSLVAPLLLVGTVVVSFLAALGISELAFRYIFDFAALSEGLELLAFVFLVALGVDYNIFLVTRAREEALRHGTREGMLKALAVTGGVITSAGIVLAGTFAVFINFPLVALSQIGFLVAFGVLLDTLIVRSILVPALTLDIGRHFWWPSQLSRKTPSAE